MGDSKKKTTKKSTGSKKRGKSNIVAKPEIIKNRFVFRDQLDAINFDLAAEIVKNIKLMTNPKDRADYLMRLAPYAWNKLDTIQMLGPAFHTGGQGEGEERNEVIEGQLLESGEGEFDDLLKNI